MGGTVAVTIREPDGKEHRMSRWTMAFPDLVHDPRFIAKDPTYIADYLKRWYEMREDWIQNHETGKFKHRMTPCYGDGIHLAPDDYGLIVLDQKENRVLSMQSYTTFGIFGTSAVWLALNGDGVTVGVGCNVVNPIDLLKNKEVSLEQHLAALEAVDPDNYAVSFFKLFADGRIKSMQRSPDEELLSLTHMGTEELARVVLEDRPGYSYFPVDLSPFAITEYDENSTGATQMRQDILDLGFVLTDEEERFWEEWIRSRLEAEEDS